MTGFAHAADDDAAASSLDHGDSGDERPPETALDRGAEGSEAPSFCFERAQCAGDQRVVAFAHGLVFTAQHRFRHGEVEASGRAFGSLSNVYGGFRSHGSLAAS